MARVDFDPVQTGKAEVEWWIAHNNKDKEGLFKFLILQNVLLFGISQDGAKRALGSLMEAVKSHDAHDWEPAIVAATKYYQVIKDETKLDFEPRKAALLEVGWWKLHDQLEFIEDKKPLADAFAKLYSTIFGVDQSKLEAAGREKTKATREHDLAEDPNTPPNEVAEHWKKAEGYLVNFYTELKKAL